MLSTIADSLGVERSECEDNLLEGQQVGLEVIFTFTYTPFCKVIGLVFRAFSGVSLVSSEVLWRSLD